MKPLIICYSHSGNNEKLALKLKGIIGCKILRLEEKKKRKTISILLDFIFNRNSRLSCYELWNHEHDAYILVAPIWGGRIATPMRAFLEKEKNNIHRYYLITLCNGVEGQKQKITAELTSIIQRAPMGVTELWINCLLPKDQKNKVKHTFNYRVSDNELMKFEENMESFIDIVMNEENGEIS